MGVGSEDEMARPDFIAHWSELENAEPQRYEGSDEPMGFDASLGRKLGLSRLDIHHHVRWPAGHRTSYPHAKSAEEEFVFVIDGEPDAWIDGTLHRLRPGDAVAFPAGTGISHRPQQYAVVGERRKPENRGRYPLDLEIEEGSPYARQDAPAHELGPHDAKAQGELGGNRREWREVDCNTQLFRIAFGSSAFHSP